MATLDSLSSLFEKPMPENPTLFDSLWSQMKHTKPVEDSSTFTEIFGELHFQEKPSPPLSDEKNGRSVFHFQEKPSPPPSDEKNGRSVFPAKTSESLLLCTEGLGSESSDDVDDLMEGGGDDWRKLDKGRDAERRGYSEVRSRRSGGGFPPPISSIGRSGKPWIFFESSREDGRFVLREIRIPTHEFLQASREDGRLKLHIVHPDEAISEGEEEQDDDDDDDEQKEEVEERHSN